MTDTIIFIVLFIVCWCIKTKDILTRCCWKIGRVELEKTKATSATKSNTEALKSQNILPDSIKNSQKNGIILLNEQIGNRFLFSGAWTTTRI